MTITAPGTTPRALNAAALERPVLGPIDEGARTGSAPSTADRQTGLFRAIEHTSSTAPSLLEVLERLRAGISALTPPDYVAGEPVYDYNHADPSIVRGDDGYYYSMATNTRYGEDKHVVNVPMIRSRDLVSWEFVGDALPVKPSWVAKDMWAPDVQRTGDHFTMFYSARDAAGAMKIGYATAPEANGPFTDQGVLVASSLGGATTIDPYFHETADGTTYLYWGSGAALTGQEVSVGADGTIQMIGTPTKVLARNDSDPWERILVEGAWMEEHDGQYYLYYSAGSWEDMAPGYAVFVARSDAPLGPFEKQGEPILKSTGAMHSPGHMSITQDDAGQSWMLHHSWIADDAGSVDRSGGRVMMLQPITYGPDGWPVVDDGLAPNPQPQPGPRITPAKPDAPPTPHRGVRPTPE